MTNPEPLVPAEVDLRDFAFMPLDVLRLRDSDLAALSSGEEFKAAVMLWCVAWHQVPAASLPDDDRLLAKYSGAGTRWKKVREAALRGFILCSDGRLYHRTIAEKAVEAWTRKQAQRQRTIAATAAREQRRRETSTARDAQRDVPRDVAIDGARDDLRNVARNVDRYEERNVVQGTGTGTGTGTGKRKTNGAVGPSQQFCLPDWIPAGDWQAFDEHRKKSRKPMTDRARQLVVLELDKLRKLGHDPAAVLQQSVRRGWLDVFPLKGEQASGGQQVLAVAASGWARGGL